MTRICFGNFIFFLLLCNCCHAQTVTDTIKMNFDFLTIKDGLSQGMVQCILQDKDGYMWFSSKDGLNRYDGYRMTVFRNKPGMPYSLPDNYVTCMLEDEKGNFFVGTSTKGICLFDKRSEKFYPITAVTNAFQKNEDVYSIVISNGKLLVTTNINAYAFDISRLKPGIFTGENLGNIKLQYNYNARQPLSSRKFQIGKGISQQWLKEGSLWIFLIDSVSITRFDSSFSNPVYTCLPATQVGTNGTERYSIMELPGENRFVILALGKIILFDTKQHKVTYSGAIQNNNIGAGGCFLDQQNRFYFYTTTGNYCFNPATLQLTKVVSNAGSFIILMNSFTDRSGTLWVGSSGHGIFKYNSRKLRFHNPGIGSWYYAQGRSGDLFVYDMDVFLKRMNPVTGKVTGTVPFPNKKPNGDRWNDGRVGVQGMQCDQEGILWSVSADKPNSIYLAWYNTVNQSAGVKQIAKTGRVQFRKLFIDNNNRLWLVKHNDNNSRSWIEYDKTSKEPVKVHKFPIEKDLNEYSFVSDFWQDAQDVFWFGTIQGLFSFNEKKNIWRHWKNNPSDNNSLSGDMIFSVCPDAVAPEKYLWVGTNGNGLNRFEYATGKCIRYAEKDGLPNEVVYCMLTDNAGNLWMSTNKGLSCLNPQTNQFRNFTEEDGLPGNEFNRYEKLKLQSGDLLFGGVAGFTSFNAAEVLQQNPAPSIVLTGLSVYNKPIDHITDSAIIHAPVGYAQTITLPHDKNMFTIEFAALESSPAEKKQYAYYLENFNEDWIPNGNRNTATYTNIPPGSYTFHVKGTNSDGVWNEKGTSIRIIILPAWYQTWWFRISLLLIVAGGIYAFYHFRLAQQLKLQRIRNNIASDLHDEIGSTLSSISISSTIIQNKMEDDTSEVKGLLKQISSNTDNMMEAMSDIVWAINTKNDRFDNIVNRMRSFAIEILEPKNVQLHMQVSEQLNHITLNMQQRKNFFLIFKEAVNNTAKYAGCKNVWVDIENKGGKIILKVKDDGKGFSSGSVKAGNSQKLGGNGLVNMYRRATELKGKMTIDSVPGEGTVVNLAFTI